jgi:hypothetical protein
MERVVTWSNREACESRPPVVGAVPGGECASRYIPWAEIALSLCGFGTNPRREFNLAKWTQTENRKYRAT